MEPSLILTAPTFVVALVLGLAAGATADWLLASDPLMRAAIDHDGHRALHVRRLVRCLAAIVALLVLAFAGWPVPRLVAAGLMTVTAATDFECRILPPDAFVYGAAAAGCAATLAAGGAPGLVDAVATQAVCFALTTLSVLLFRATDPGDIKAMMQFGAACGSMPSLAQAVLAQAAVSAVAVLALRVRTGRWPARLPLATLAWAGLVASGVVDSVTRASVR